MNMTIQDFENLPAEEQMELYETVRQSIDRRWNRILKDGWGIDVTEIHDTFTRRSRPKDVERHPNFIREGETVVDVRYSSFVKNADGTGYILVAQDAFPLRWLDKDCDYMKEIGKTEENR